MLSQQQQYTLFMLATFASCLYTSLGVKAADAGIQSDTHLSPKEKVMQKSFYGSFKKPIPCNQRSRVACLKVIGQSPYIVYVRSVKFYYDSTDYRIKVEDMQKASKVKDSLEYYGLLGKGRVCYQELLELKNRYGRPDDLVCIASETEYKLLIAFSKGPIKGYIFDKKWDMQKAFWMQEKIQNMVAAKFWYDSNLKRVLYMGNHFFGKLCLFYISLTKKELTSTITYKKPETKCKCTLDYTPIGILNNNHDFLVVERPKSKGYGKLKSCKRHDGKQLIGYVYHLNEKSEKEGGKPQKQIDLSELFINQYIHTDIINRFCLNNHFYLSTSNQIYRYDMTKAEKINQNSEAILKGKCKSLLLPNKLTQVICDLQPLPSTGQLLMIGWKSQVFRAMILNIEQASLKKKSDIFLSKAVSSDDSGDHYFGEYMDGPIILHMKDSSKTCGFEYKAYRVEKLTR